MSVLYNGKKKKKRLQYTANRPFIVIAYGREKIIKKSTILNVIFCLLLLLSGRGDLVIKRRFPVVFGNILIRRCHQPIYVCVEIYSLTYCNNLIAVCCVRFFQTLINYSIFVLCPLSPSISGSFSHTTRRRARSQIIFKNNK